MGDGFLDPAQPEFYGIYIDYYLPPRSCRQILSRKMAEEVTCWRNRVQDGPVFRNFIYEDSLIVYPRQSGTQAARQRRHAPKLSREMKPHGRPIVRRRCLSAWNAVVVRKAQQIHHGQRYASALHDSETSALVQSRDDQRVFNRQFKERFRKPLYPSLVGLVACIAKNMHVVRELERVPGRSFQPSGTGCAVVLSDIASSLPNVPCVVVFVRTDPDHFRAPPALIISRKSFVVWMLGVGLAISYAPPGLASSSSGL